MIRKLWLVFCQAATVCVAALFVVTTLRPDLLAWTARGGVVTIRESQPEAEPRKVSSLSDAAKRAMPAVVNVYTTKETKIPRHPFWTTRCSAISSVSGSMPRRGRARISAQA